MQEVSEAKKIISGLICYRLPKSLELQVFWQICRKRGDRVDIQAAGNIYLDLYHVIANLENDTSKVGEPKLNLNRIHAGNTLYLTIGQTQSLIYQDTGFGEEIEVSLPKSSMSYVIITDAANEFGENQAVRLKDSDGTDTGFYLTKEGMITLDRDMTAIDGTVYKTYEDDWYKYYNLPNSVIVLTDAKTGKLISITTEDNSGNIRASYDFSKILFEKDRDGNVTSITFNSDTTDTEYYYHITYDEHGNAFMKIGTNGASTYITQDEEFSGIGSAKWNHRILPATVFGYRRQYHRCHTYRKECGG